MNKETTEINNAELSNYVTLLIAIPLRTGVWIQWNGGMEQYFGNFNLGSPPSNKDHLFIKTILL